MTPPLIRLEHASVSLAGRRVLSDVTWRLRAREHWAVLGPNGSGKSTFLRLVRGDVWPDPDGRGRRVYAVGGREQTSPVGLRERIAFVSPELQDRYQQQEGALTVEQVVASGFALTDYLHHRLDARQRERVDALLSRFGIAALRRRNVQQVSQGELRRALIARALANQPRVLVLDEFCDGLDAASRRGLLERLNDFTRLGVQFLYTTHRPGELLRCITHVLVIENGRIAWQGPRVERWAPPRQIGKRVSPLAEAVLGAPAQVQHETSDSKPVCAHRCGTAAPFLFRLRGVSVFLGRKPVLRDLHWQMNADENWVVLGRNGAGKSTLLKLLAGEQHPALGGDVHRFEVETRHTLWQIRRRIGQVSADFQALYRDDVTGEQAIASGFFGSVGLLRRRPTARHERVVRALVRRFELGGFAGRCVQRMSYGELRRILLARGLVHDPAVLLLDEPFDGLDFGSKLAMQSALDDVSRNGTRLMIVTHHLEDLPKCITHAAVLDAGRLEATGPLSDGATLGAVARLFGTNAVRRRP